jgi:hypothetical protein
MRYSFFQFPARQRRRVDTEQALVLNIIKAVLLSKPWRAAQLMVLDKIISMT